jgi:hypothetical protein
MNRPQGNPCSSYQPRTCVRCYAIHWRCQPIDSPSSDNVQALRSRQCTQSTVSKHSPPTLLTGGPADDRLWTALLTDSEFLFIRQQTAAHSRLHQTSRVSIRHTSAGPCALPQVWFRPRVKRFARWPGMGRCQPADEGEALRGMKRGAGKRGSALPHPLGARYASSSACISTGFLVVAQKPLAFDLLLRPQLHALFLAVAVLLEALRAELALRNLSGLDRQGQSAGRVSRWNFCSGEGARCVLQDGMRDAQHRICVTTWQERHTREGRMWMGSRESAQICC